MDQKDQSAGPGVKNRRSKTAAEYRTPLPGEEVEAEAVKLAALKLLEQLDASRAYAIDKATDPRCPGLFSDALHHGLCSLAHQAADAAGLLRRLPEAVWRHHPWASGDPRTHG